jgi:hypothetical protein
MPKDHGQLLPIAKVSRRRQLSHAPISEQRIENHIKGSIPYTFGEIPYD